MRARENRKRPIAILIIVVISLLLARIVFPAAAATGALSLSRSSATVTAGDTFVITVNVVTDIPVTIAQARVTFNTSLVSYLGTDYTGTAFNTDEPTATNGNGFVFISRYKNALPFPSGANTVAKLSFKSLANGTANFSIDQSQSALYSASDASNILSSVSGSTVTIQAPPQQSPQPQQPTPAPNQTAPPTSGTGSTTRNSTSQQRSTSGTAPSGNASSPSSNNNEQTPVNSQEQPPQPVMPSSTNDQFGGEVTTEEPVDMVTQLKNRVLGLMPVILIGVVILGAGWFGFKRYRQRPYGFTANAVDNVDIKVFDATKPVTPPAVSTTNPPSAPPKQ